MSLARGLLAVFSSVRFGIVLMALLFLYMSVGSAGIIYPVHPNIFHPDAWVHEQLRQWPALEMTEFEWFHWWPFDLLIALIALCMATTTVRHIRLSRINLGVWMIHTGILVLIAGSVIYFHTKVEGDAPVARRKVVVTLEGIPGTVELIASPGATAHIGEGEDRLAIEVAEIDPAWSMRTGADQGEGAYSVTVMVTSASRRFMRQLIAGHPEYTEDLILTDDPKQPMKRAVKETGTAIVDPRLSMVLDYEAQEYFYLRNDLAKSWALYVRPVGAAKWTMRPIDGLPLYNDRIASRGDVFEADDETPVAVDPISLTVGAVAVDDPFPDVALTVSGYLRYAQTKSLLVAGGEGAPFNPTVALDISSADGAKARYRLIAFDPERATAYGGLIRMVSLENESAIAGLGEPASIRIVIPGAGVDLVEPIRGHSGEGPPPFVTIADPELGYAYRVLAAQDNLPVGAKHASVLIVDIKMPTRTIRRWVFDDAILTRDVPEAGAAHGTTQPPDEAISMEYRPGGGRSLLTLAVGPASGQLRLVSSIGDGKGEIHPVSAGVPITLPEGLTVTVTSYEPRAVIETKPMIVPLSQRIRDAREMFAQTHVSAAGGSAAWVEFSPYAYDDFRFTLPRHPYNPARIRLADGREMEVLFSRQRVPLGTLAALEEFVLTAHDGGYTGESGSIRNYTSLIRFKDSAGAAWSEPVAVSVNEPVEHEGLWYFQAQWDPPEPPSERNQRGSAGLNYTVLGVGNRNGVWIQLAGCVIAVSGMIYAFYVKPVLIRRRSARARAAALLTLVMASGAGAAVDGDFASRVDLSPLGSVAVQTDGRVKSFGSFARSEMALISGPKRIADQSPEYTYLDLLMRPEAYVDADVIFVKGGIIRAPIAQAILTADPRLSERMESFTKSGLISEALLARPETEAVLSQMQADLLRTEKPMSALRSARALMRRETLLSRLRVIPPPPGDDSGRFRSIAEVMLLAADPAALRAAGESAKPLPGIDPKTQLACAMAWKGLVEAWTNGDAERVNEAVASLAAVLPSMNPSAYPDAARLSWESWYFANGNLVWIWMVYALSVTLLLLGVSYQWRWAKFGGLTVFGVAFVLHTLALALRWWISGRWPNSNMFEAVTTSAWFGACAAIILEFALRRRAAAGMFALVSGIACAAALMAAHFLPVELNAQISNMMPVLHDVWLYIHTNVIIFSYCLIFMAALAAVGYLGYRMFGGAAVYARVGVGGAVLAGSSSEGGAAAPDPRQRLRGERLGEMLDGVTMLLMKLSFVLLWTGIAMGAIWADHSWGRPWGWDPKEVFALNTFVVFALLVHVRYKVRDKGLWTAVLAVVGAAVMLFNWIVINFVITGLHSYA